MRGTSHSSLTAGRPVGLSTAAWPTLFHSSITPRNYSASARPNCLALARPLQPRDHQSARGIATGPVSHRSSATPFPQGHARSTTGRALPEAKPDGNPGAPRGRRRFMRTLCVQLPLARCSPRDSAHPRQSVCYTVPGRSVVDWLCPWPGRPVLPRTRRCRSRTIRLASLSGPETVLCIHEAALSCEGQ